MNFGREENPVPLAVLSESLSRNSFAGSATINIGRIQKVDSGVNCCVDDTERLILLRSPSKIHASEAKRAYLNSRAAQSAVFHKRLLNVMCTILSDSARLL